MQNAEVEMVSIGPLQVFIMAAEVLTALLVQGAELAAGQVALLLYRATGLMARTNEVAEGAALHLLELLKLAAKVEAVELFLLILGR
jgi:hypothetical protein